MIQMAYLQLLQQNVKQAEKYYLQAKNIWPDISEPELDNILL